MYMYTVVYVGSKCMIAHQEDAVYKSSSNHDSRFFRIARSKQKYVTTREYYSYDLAMQIVQQIIMIYYILVQKSNG